MKKAILSTLAAEAFQDRSRILTKVHSHFEHGFNLKWDQGLLYVSQGPYLAALGLILEGITYLPDVQDGLQFKLELHGEQLTVQPYLYTQQSRTTYQVEYVDLSIPHLSSLSHKQKAMLQCFPPAYFWKHTGFSRIQALEILYENYANSSSLLPADIQAFVGAGLGLTPSGDDFIMGMMLVNEALALNLPIHVDTKGTTAVSQSYYYALGKKQVARPWICLLEALQGEDLEEFKKVVELVQRVGSTSGNDTLLGIFTLLYKVYQLSEG